MARWRHPLPAVTTSDLSRTPGDVLGRVARGERLIGWAFGDEHDQIERLSPPQRGMLMDGYRQWRIRPTRVDHRFDWSVLMRALEDMYVRGLVRKTPRGNELTGRGLTLRETLLRMEGREKELDL